MGLWSIVIPALVEITNLVGNPSIEIGTTGYTAVGGSVARAGAGRRGRFLLGVTPTTAVNDGVYFGNVSLSSGSTYTFSLDFRSGGGDVPYKIYFATTGGTLKGTPTQFTGSTGWKRVSVTWTADATASFRLYIVKDNHASPATFYIDGLLCVQLDHDVVYFDGDSPDCRWSGTAHGSPSIAEVQARSIGEVVKLSDMGVFIGPVEGVGMVQSAHQVSSRSLLPGAEYQGSKVLPRAFLMAAGIRSSLKTELHSYRKALIDAIKHDLTPGDKPFALRYSGANPDQDVEIRCVVDAEAAKLFMPDWQDIAVRLMAYDPYFYDTGDSNAGLTVTNSATLRYFGARINHEWQTITPSAVTDPGAGISAKVIMLTHKFGDAAKKGGGSVFATSRRAWVGGAFLNWDGIANADYIAYYDFDDAAWHAAGTGADDVVWDIILGPDGRVYACGAFLNIGGTAANRIAVWNGSAWAALGTGLNGIGYCMAFGRDGNLYAGGAFTTAGGTTVNRFAKWDGSAWSALSTDISNGVVTGMDVAQNGYIYLTGTFTAPEAYVMYWDGADYVGMGAGLGALGRSVKVAANGDVYVCGAFTTADGVSCVKAAKWNGQTFTPLGSGLTGGDGWRLDIDSKGNLYVSGDFTAAGGLSTANGIAMWNGSSWVNLDIDLPGTPIGYAIESYKDDLFIGFDTTGTATFGKLNSVTNDGTARAYPRLVVSRSGGTSAKLEYLKNETTGATLWIDHKLLDGETVIIDLAEGERSMVSSVFGNVWSCILRGSQTGKFFLAPGANLISAFVSQTGSPTIVEYLQWVNRYESIDGVAT